MNTVFTKFPFSVVNFSPQQLHKFLVPYYLIITVSYKYVTHGYKFLNTACDSIQGCSCVYIFRAAPWDWTTFRGLLLGEDHSASPSSHSPPLIWGWSLVRFPPFMLACRFVLSFLRSCLGSHSAEVCHIQKTLSHGRHPAPLALTIFPLTHSVMSQEAQVQVLQMYQLGLC